MTTEFEAQAAAMRAQLEICAKTFDRYAQIHLAKRTEEGNRKATENAAMGVACWEALDGKAGVAALLEFTQLEVQVKTLQELVNTPVFEDFTEAVKREGAHQIARWGKAHDRSKSAENWFWLVGYLAGKALRANIDGDREKALHHTISSAAALMQWHAAIKGDPTGCGLGDDVDLKAKQA